MQSNAHLLQAHIFIQPMMTFSVNGIELILIDRQFPTILASSSVQASGHLKDAKISETKCSDCTPAVSGDVLVPKINLT